MLTLLFDGIAYGMLLFILAVGLAVTLGLMNFINLAHGAFAMAGGYVLVLLMQRAGWKTTSVPVNHRHRTAGVSKYNNLGRALVGIRDLRGVAWLITRSKRTAVEER